MNLEELKELIELINVHNISELDMEREGFKIRIKKGMTESETLDMLPTIVEKFSAGPRIEIPANELAARAETSEESSAQGAQNPSAEAASESADDGLIDVNSPMVGTFYRAAAPDADPYVDLGDKVSEDTVLCIVEAMKLMNEIKAEVRGTITEVLVENGHPVEFGQPLFKIQPGR